MKHIYEGKTKSVFELEDGNILLKLKDDVTGEDGKFDPGANEIMGKIDGMANASLKMSQYYFSLLTNKGVKNHFLSADLSNNTMVVKPAVVFGHGVEIICRFKAYGSFIRRYGLYINSGDNLNCLVEMTLKDDERQDPLITDEALAQLNIMTIDEYVKAKELVRRVALIIKEDLSAKGLEIYDIKFELGLVDGQIAIIDDISAGNMRVFRDGVQVEPLQLAEIVVG